MKGIPSTCAARPAPRSGFRLSVFCDWNATIEGGKRQAPNTSIITATAEDAGGNAESASVSVTRQ